MKLVLFKSRTSLRNANTGSHFLYLIPLLLFIFFISSVAFHKVPLLLKIDAPGSFTSAQKLTGKAVYSVSPWIYVGEPLTSTACLSNAKYQIQVNDVFIDYDQIPLYVEQYFHMHMPLSQKVIFLKIDKKVKMEVVFKIREQIRDTHIRRICYVVR